MGRNKSNRDNALKDIESGNTKVVVEALLSLAYHDPDRQFLQELMIKHSNSTERDIRYMALLCFSHIVRIHGKLDKEKVIPILRKALKDTDHYICATAEEVIQDIDIYYGSK